MKCWMVLLLSAVLAGTSAGQELNLVLDQVPVLAGAGIGGFIEIAPSDSSDLTLESVLSAISGDLSFVITTPTGKQHEVSKRTSDEIRSGRRGRRTVAYPYAFRMPVFLLAWRDTLLFEGAGKYQIIARLDDYGSAGAMADTVSLEVSAPGGGFDRWRATILSRLPDCVTAFCMPGAGPGTMASSAIAKGSEYGPSLQYLSAYQFGGAIIPWLVRKPWRIPDPTDRRATRAQIDSVLAEGRALAGHGTAMEQMLPYLEALADSSWTENAAMRAARATQCIWLKD